VNTCTGICRGSPLGQVLIVLKMDIDDELGSLAGRDYVHVSSGISSYSIADRVLDCPSSSLSCSKHVPGIRV
jgi:hypothetical protein